MSPSAENYESQIGRNLVAGDVLTLKGKDIKPVEVVNNNVEDGMMMNGTKINGLGIEVRELTPFGPKNESYTLPKNIDVFDEDGIVKWEDRTDLG